MNKITDKIIETINSHKTSFIYGGWGIGKTSIFKKQIYTNLSTKSKVLYIDARLFDLQNNLFEHLGELVHATYSNETVEKIKKISKKVANAGMFITNTFLKTNLPYINLNKKSNTVDKIMEKANNLILIIDELDRVTPNTILKALNFINAISSLPSPIKIVAIGNKEEMNSILKTSFGLDNSKDFMHKYFECSLDISAIQSNALISLAKNNKWIQDIDWQDTKITPRELEYLIKEYDVYSSRYEEAFSPLVFIVFLIAGVYKNSDIDFSVYEKGFQVLNNYKTFAHERGFQRTDSTGRVWVIKDDREGFYGSISEPIRDILKGKYSFSNFDAWIAKFFHNNIFNEKNKS